MAKSNVVNMTSGNITKHLIAFSLPMLAGNLFQQLYNMVDSIIVGRYVGANALGSVGSVGSLNFLFFSLCIGLANGIGILVSQYFGENNEERVKVCVAQAVYVILASGLLMSILGFALAKPILQFMNTPAKNFQDAYVYMRIVCGCTFIVAAYNGVSAILRALGDSKTPLYFLLIASVTNIILDLVFVIGFNMGVAGAAYATVISQLISAVGSIIWGMATNPYMKLSAEYFRFDSYIVSREVKMGLPLAVQTATIAISCVILQSVVNKFGSVVMAAYTATNRVEQLVQQPFNSLGVALSTFAGQNYGSRKPDRILASGRIGMIITAIFSAIMIGVMYLFGPDIVGIFITEPEVVKIGAEGLRLTSLMYLFLGMIYVMRGLLNGVGDVTFSMINGFLEVAGRIGFALLLIGTFGFGYQAVWYTNGFTWTIVGIITLIRFYKGRWRAHIS